MQDKIVLTASGEIGVGKSALLEFLNNALLAHDFAVTFFDEEAIMIDRNMGLSGNSLEILECYNPAIVLVEEIVVDMAHITTNAELTIGREYWVRSKVGQRIGIAKCDIYDGWKYLSLYNGIGNKFWAMDANTLALDTFDIVGPIPEQDSPDFDNYIKS